ncbi:hypothetical protein [Novosphingobium resinovorum]|uniref:Uncharacterized protein n=1 Tax=Novosphingobium resinovorum TaxID=158500 RepID=A0A1D8A373_9SPHN|nr:hypothetical protein [Novosphingobium resinovorum]AOR76559.1 hypothetical protein BES08_07215 [Novosphingobium resinovorum]
MMKCPLCDKDTVLRRAPYTKNAKRCCANTLCSNYNLAVEPAPAKSLVKRCTEIADKVVPKYRNPPKGRSYSCSSHTAKLWQAAWDGACVALNGNPAEYVQ